MVSIALVVEREEEGHALKVQHPVYFISEVLSNSKTHYPPNPEASICYPHHQEEAMPLLRVTSSDGRDVLPPW